VLLLLSPSLFALVSLLYFKLLFSYSAIQLQVLNKTQVSVSVALSSLSFNEALHLDFLAAMFVA